MERRQENEDNDDNDDNYDDNDGDVNKWWIGGREGRLPPVRPRAAIRQAATIIPRLKMYFLICISQNVFLKMYFSKCM